MSDIKKSVPHVYAFIGRDDFSIAEKMRTWMKVFEEKHGNQGVTIFDCALNGDLAGRLKTALQGSGLFQTQTLIVVKNLWSAKSSDAQVLLLDTIESLPATHFLVIIDTSMDGRTTLAKTLSQMQKKNAASVELYDVPVGPRLREWIVKRVQSLGGSFEENAGDFFLQAYAAARDSVGKSEPSPFDLWYLDNEIRKLVSYASARKIMSDDIASISSLPSSSHIFHLTDALLEKKRVSALRIVHDLVGEDASRARPQFLSLIAYLLSQFHSFVLLKSMEEDGLHEADSAGHLAWDSKRVWVVSKKIRSSTCDSLMHQLRALLDFERVLKTGAGDPLLHSTLLIHTLTH